MKKRILIFAAACILLAGGQALAQHPGQQRAMRERPSAEQMAQHLTDRMKQHLQLTDEQSRQIYQYNLEQIKKREQQRGMRHQTDSAAVKELKGILTPEQFAKWEEMRKHRPRHGAPDGRMRPDGRRDQGAAGAATGQRK